MLNILNILPGTKKHTQSGWVCMNAICCHHRGHRPDTKKRGGLMMGSDGISFTWHCFNCGYKCAFHLGQTISGKTKSLLQWCGIDQLQIQAWSLESLKQKDILDLIPKKEIANIKFTPIDLPLNAILLDHDNPSHIKFSHYVKSRSLPLDFPFMITPTIDDSEPIRNKNRIIIPYTHDNKIVGYSSRYLDDRAPKYINHQPPGYVYGIDNQHHKWKYTILTEGILDAISIDGCGLLHNEISNMQAQTLAKLNTTVIFVPDQDKTGLSMTDRALELGYMVSLPDWQVKDPNDAVCKYGKLVTTAAIIQNAVQSRIKIELRKKQILKDIK